jgi:hypothetical protein
MLERADSFTDAAIEVGTWVRYDGLVGGGPEFGVVIHAWFDAEADFHDCYVAFFGAELPVGALTKKPYVLRYASGSLARLEIPAADVG